MKKSLLQNMHKKLRKWKSLLGAILFCSGAGKNVRTSSLALALEVSPHCSANTVSPFLSDNSLELGSVAGPVIQANWSFVLRMTWGLEACFTVFYSVCTKLAYGHFGKTQGWLCVGERVIWAVGLQLKALLASSSGICCWVSPDQYKQTKVLGWWDDNTS